MLIVVNTEATTRATRGLMQIGDVAERTGLSLPTVRHYEDVGLLPEAERSPGGFRLYTDAAVERLLLIKQMKPLEFTLEEMREVLDTFDELADGPTAARRRELLGGLVKYQALISERITKLRERLRGARALQDTLDDLLL